MLTRRLRRVTSYVTTLGRHRGFHRQGERAVPEWGAPGGGCTGR